MQVKVLQLNHLKPFSEYERYLPLVSDRRREKIQSLKNDKDKIVSLFSELFILSIVGVSPKDILYNEYGKPYVDRTGYHFSISHSHSLIVFVSDSLPVGIDIEPITDKKWPAVRFFTPNEKALVKSPEDFYTIWTKKEAYIKMLGTGLSTPLSSFDVTESIPETRFLSTHTHNHIISVCTKNNQNTTLNLHFLSEKDFLSLL
ncbi:MAG: 4'-phosphopantetheinyl transferase superfamily protein [Clostridia bacterium]|nr:4'-phosphopantetheinyl transferase superfamily protein [Clostridia bacterium]